MHRFFLHSLRSAQLLRDRCGADFPDIEAAVSNARAVADLLCDQGIEIGEDRSDWSLLIADDGGQEVARVALRDLVMAPLSGRDQFTSAHA